MMLTTYALDYQPPLDRDKPEICYYVKRYGRKHFEALKKELPVLENVEKELEAEQAAPKPKSATIIDDTNKKMEEENFRKLLFKSEWVSIGPFGRLIEPKIIPLNMTQAEERRLWKLYEETEFCVTDKEEIKDDTAGNNQNQEVAGNIDDHDHPGNHNEQEEEKHEYECLEERRQNAIIDARLRQNYKKYEEDPCQL